MKHETFFRRFKTKLGWGAALTWGACPSWAHEGHGLSGSHWHASDAFGFVAALVVVALLWWGSKNK